MQLVEPGFLAPLSRMFHGSLPRWIPVRQKLVSRAIPDIPEAIAQEFRRRVVTSAIRPGMKVALAVGSRGIDRIFEVVRAVVSEVHRLGADAVIVPSMGSHGGATAEGQRAVLASYGITEQSVGVPIDARMDVVHLGRLPQGMDVYQAQAAMESDAVIPICRVKAHTAFRGPIESGLAKMLVIGLGKYQGAIAAHRMGMARFHELIPQGAEMILQRSRVPFGLALIEDAHHRLAHVEVVEAADILTREPQLLEMSKAWMARILADEFEVLVVEEIGKDISGDGMDPNVTGRFNVPHVRGTPKVERIVVLGLTPGSHGNAIGLGAADFTTRKTLQQIDFLSTYTNCLTARVLQGAKIPIVAENDRDALCLAFNTLVGHEPESARGVIIKNTSALDEIWVTESLWNQDGAATRWEPLGPPRELSFDEDGNLVKQATLGGAR